MLMGKFLEKKQTKFYGQPWSDKSLMATAHKKEVLSNVSVTRERRISHLIPPLLKRLLEETED